MGRLIKICRMRPSVYIINSILGLVTFGVWLVFQYTREFFVIYPFVDTVFMFLQWLCLFLILAIVVIIYLQYQKAGTYVFYQNGVLNKSKNEFYYYHDIMTYAFIPQSNKRATDLYFETDSMQEDKLSALLDKEAFVLFQEGHARIWSPFVLKQLEAKRIISFDVDEDVTSFKMQLIGDDTQDKALILSHEGMVCYGKFYNWYELTQYEVTFTGMLMIKNSEQQTVFMEPLVNIERYFVFMSVLDYFLPKQEKYE